MSPYLRTSLAAGGGRIVSKRWRGRKIADLRQRFVCSMAVCNKLKVCVVIFIGSNAIYAGGIDESLEEAALPYLSGKTLNQQSLQIR